MDNKKKPAICVFCGSSFGSDPQYAVAARTLGRLIAEQAFSLVFGGGNIGLMGEVARAARAGGAEVTGIIPDFLHQRPGMIDARSMTEIVVTETMQDRKSRMFELADAFVALPGGIGTLEETIEMLTWAQLELHTKPVILINTEGYWNNLISMIDAMAHEDFLDHANLKAFCVVSTPDEAVDAISRALNR